MALEVDVHQLAIEASKVAGMARDIGTALPRGWVVPAGTDSISSQHVPALNATTADVFNGIRAALNDVQRSAQKVGRAAEAYSTENDRGARLVNGSGGELVRNPVDELHIFKQQDPPVLSFPSVATPSIR